MSEAISRIITACRVCQRTSLEPILSLGDLYISNFIDEEAVRDDTHAPLELVLCSLRDGGCGLLQLKHTVAGDVMYKTYWYRSGMNATMTNELCGIARKIEEIIPLKAGDSVIDIGANDGTLIRGYSVQGLHTVGYEPAQNLSEYNRVGTSAIIGDFFNAQAWKDRYGEKKAKAITAIAMFYDLDDPNAFVADVVSCLDKDGVFIIQMSYLPLMLSENAFDNICHEHLEYYSLQSLSYLLEKHGLEVFDVELNNVNGGSFRTFVRHKGGGVGAPIGSAIRVASLQAYEQQLGFSDPSIYREFADRVEHIKNSVRGLISEEISRGKKVFVYGASTKGNTLLQYFGLDSSLIAAAAERNPEKWGKKTIATEIPIISEEEARAQNPDYFLILPWHFLDEFIQREKRYLRNGGKFIVPLPQFRIIGV